MKDLAGILEERIAGLEGNIQKEVDANFVDVFLKSFKLGGELKGLVEKYLSLKPHIPLIWLSLSECTGCTESFLRNEVPGVENLLLDFIRLDYHDVLMVDSGFHAKRNLKNTLHQGGYFLVVEGGVCDGSTESYATFGAEAMSAKSELLELVENAEAIFGVGTCAAFGGVQAAHPNPSHAKGMGEFLRDKSRYMTIPGCPPSDMNIVLNLMYVFIFGRMPELDASYRALWAYGKSVHDSCERKARFESGDFVQSFDDDRNKEGYCLYKVGCKGPYAFNNCAKMKFNSKTSWPIQAGHGCIACSEANFWDEFGVYEEPMRKGLRHFSKPSEVGEVRSLSLDLEKFYEDLGDGIGVFLDSKNTVIMANGENILEASFESSAGLILEALSKKSKLTARLVENYKREFASLYDACMSQRESRVSSNVADVLKITHELLSLDNEENPHLRAVSEAHGFEFKQISDMDFSTKVVDGKIVIDVSKGLRLPLCYRLGGLEYDGIAYGVLATLCKALKSGIAQYQKEKNLDPRPLVLGGDLAQNALVQKWMLEIK